jgi:hypothetical protein
MRCGLAFPHARGRLAFVQAQCPTMTARRAVRHSAPPKLALGWRPDAAMWWKRIACAKAMYATLGASCDEMR